MDVPIERDPRQGTSLHATTKTGCRQNNPQHTSASNLNVSHYRTLGVLALAAPSLMMFSAAMSATPITPTAQELLKEAQRPPMRYIPARVGWGTGKPTPIHVNLVLEQYGPQATVRAVRSSLKAALTPDPLAMGSLLFCAFALRFMRSRREQESGKKFAVPNTEVVLPKAA
jgi:hypothetical protein